MRTKRGILAYGAYLPVHRLRRELIASATGTPADGHRSVAYHDEDTTTLGVEAARRAVASVPDAARESLRASVFATTRPAYLEKTNASAIHAALGLPQGVGAYDMVGSVRSGMGALRSAIGSNEPTLVVMSDIRSGRPGSRDERDGGDGAAALVCGAESPGVPVVAEVLGMGAATVEMLHRWRLPGEQVARTWEERFVDHVYTPLLTAAIGDALDEAAVSVGMVDHLIVTGTHSRAAATVVRCCGFASEVLVDDLGSRVGNAGVAHPGILLCATLENAEPGAIILVVTAADGIDAMVLRATDAVAATSPGRTVEQQVASGRDDLTYHDFLVWREELRPEPPPRPRPAPPAAPPSLRSMEWKFGFVGSRCTSCGSVHLPPARVCSSCRVGDAMEPAPLMDRPAVVAAFAIDRLASSPGGSIVTAVLDFDGGGRFECEVTAGAGRPLQIGDRMEMTFRRLFTAEGIHDYFWKARLAGGAL